MYVDIGQILRSKSARLVTFKVWTLEFIATATQLAADGLFYTGLFDTAQYLFSHGHFNNWTRVTLFLSSIADTFKTVHL